MRWDRPRSGRAAQAEERKSLLETATQIAGLFAGLATVVYATGAVVLALRLSSDDLPWANVVAQLPREFILSVGAGQVLLPSLLAGALYALYRLIRPDGWAAPTIPRMRDGFKLEGLRILVGVYARNILLLVTPVIFVLLLRGASGPSPPLWLAGLGLLALFIAAMAIHEARGMVARRYSSPRSWNSTKAAAIMAGVYVAASIPAMMAAAAAVPLTDAKACVVGENAVKGVLVGETSDRVYLGEYRDEDPSLAVIPFSKVEEMFIGSDVSGSTCKFPPAAKPQQPQQPQQP